MTSEPASRLPDPKYAQVDTKALEARLRFRAETRENDFLGRKDTMEWQAADTIATLQAEVERLREALKPFADVADFMDSETSGFADSDILHLVVKDESSERIAAEFFAWPVQLFRAARAALGASDA